MASTVAIDDLLADVATRGIRDLVVEIRVPATGAHAHLVRAAAVVGVRIHAAPRPFDPTGVAAFADEHAIEGLHFEELAAAMVPVPTRRLLVRSLAVRPLDAGWPARVHAIDIDLLCPMALMRGTDEVARLLRHARDQAPITKMWGGLRAHAGERLLLRAQLRAAVASGCEGVLLVTYDPTQLELLDEFASA
ncbi:MAG: hypothetical protein HY071_00640 [Chloroflexi bacterium]|nr:hypothetical protein [Chloroflexota bacterium]